MAKQAARTLSQVVAFAEVAWFKETNRARPTGDYGELNALRNSFKERGWLIDDNGTIKTEELADSLIERALKERQDKWDTLKAQAAANSNTLVDLRTFEELYCEKGKLIVPKWLGISGNRRNEAFYPAMVERKKENLELSKEVPIIIRHYENALQRLMDQVDENEMKNLGFKDMSDVDRLLVAKEQVELGATQADLRKCFKDGTGQKLWSVILLDKRFPNIGIIARMRKGPEEDGFIRLASVKPSDLIPLLLRTDPKALEEKNKTLSTQGKETIKPATEEDIARHFAGEVTDGNKPKIMKRENIEQMGESSIKPIALVAKAVISNNTDTVKHLLPFGVLFNAVDDLILAGDGPFVETIIAKIARTPKEKRESVIAAVKAALEQAGA